MGTSIVNPAAVPRLLAACQAVVERWEHGDLAEAACMCSEAVQEAMRRTMSEYQHCYPTKCPKCDADLTVDDTVVLHFITAGQPGEVASRLDQDGWLMDMDNVIAHGHHSGTNCRPCGERLDGYEIDSGVTDKQKRKGKPGKTRRVEYYRLWSGNSGDSGTWDTDFINIQADTPDDKVDNAIRQAAVKIKWRDAPPVIVGYYCDADEQGDEDDGREQAIGDLLAKAEAASLKAEDLDEIVHELTASIAADINNSGMDGQLAYLIDEMGGDAVGKELDRLATEKAPNTTAVGDEEVHAECHSDDRVYSAEFNAVRWFEQADDNEVLELAEDDWGDSYAADRVGMFMADIVPDVQKMFDYLEHYNQAQTKHIGWVCTVNKDHALKWLKAHRPQLHQRMLDIKESEDGSPLRTADRKEGSHCHEAH